MSRPHANRKSSDYLPNSTTTANITSSSLPSNLPQHYLPRQRQYESSRSRSKTWNFVRKIFSARRGDWDMEPRNARTLPDRDTSPQSMNIGIYPKDNKCSIYELGQPVRVSLEDHKNNLRRSSRAAAHNFLLACGQLVCITILSTTECYHTHVSETSMQSTPHAITTCTIFAQALPASLRLLQHKSSTKAYVVGCAYGALTVTQYEVNSCDRLQRLFVGVGMLAGVCAWYPSLKKLEGERFFVVPLFFAITAALLSSALYHQLFRCIYGSSFDGNDAIEVECEPEVRANTLQESLEGVMV